MCNVQSRDPHFKFACLSCVDLSTTVRLPVPLCCLYVAGCWGRDFALSFGPRATVNTAAAAGSVAGAEGGSGAATQGRAAVLPCECRCMVACSIVSADASLVPLACPAERHVSLHSLSRGDTDLQDVVQRPAVAVRVVDSTTSCNAAGTHQHRHRSECACGTLELRATCRRAAGRSLSAPASPASSTAVVPHQQQQPVPVDHQHSQLAEANLHSPQQPTPASVGPDTEQQWNDDEAMLEWKHEVSVARCMSSEPDKLTKETAGATKDGPCILPRSWDVGGSLGWAIHSSEYISFHSSESPKVNTLGSGAMFAIVRLQALVQDKNNDWVLVEKYGVVACA
jgi:hypothetical protein